MKVSHKTEYALRAMLELAKQSDSKRVVSSNFIARRQSIPEKFLELILRELRRAGLVQSQRGPLGGHRLAKDPDAVTVGQIWRATDEAIRLERVGRKRRGADPFRYVWQNVDKAIAKVIDEATLADIVAVADGKRGLPDYTI